MKWEYKEKEYYTFPTITELNTKGKSGWELVFLQTSAKQTWKALFKRGIIKRPNTGPK